MAKRFIRFITLTMSFVMLFTMMPANSYRVFADEPEKGGSNRCLKVVTGSNQWDGVEIDTTNMGLEAGKKYDISFRLYTPDTKVGIVLQTQKTYNWRLNQGFEPINMQWHDLTATYDLTDLSGDMLENLVIVKQPNAYGGNNDDAKVTYYIDDIKVTTTNGGDSHVVYFEDFESGNALSGSAAVIKASGSTLSIVPNPANAAEPDKEEIFRATFETGLHGFAGREGSTAKRSNALAKDGKYSLRTFGRNSTSAGPLLDVTDIVTPGKTYELSVWVRLPEDTGTIPFDLKVELDGSSWPDFSGSGAKKDISGSDGWVEMKGTYTVPYSSEKVGFYLEVRYQSEAEGGKTTEFYIDEFVLSQLDVPDLPRPEFKYDPALTPLKDVYKDYFLIGNIVNPADFGAGEEAKLRYELLKHHFNVLTFENSMKPDAMWGDSVYPKDPEFNVDQYINKLEEDGFLLHGHVLSWHGQSGKWLNTGDAANYASAKANLELFMNKIAGHYNKPGAPSVYSWDVLNEAVRNTGKPLDQWQEHVLGAIWPATSTSPWYIAYGNGGNAWDYVYDAFYFARQADPAAKLYYNDYGMDDQNKATIIANMVKAVNERYAGEHPEANGRLLIEGIGMQEHQSLSTSPENVEASIQKFIATGASVSITELDVGVGSYNIKSGDVLSEEDEIRQALHFARMFQVFKKYGDSIERVTFWGVDDAHSWIENLGCVFNPDYSAKLAYYAIVDPDGFIEEYQDKLPAGPDIKKARAAYGTVTVPKEGKDLVISPVWEKTETIKTETIVEGALGASAKVRALWDENYLYVLFEVSDGGLYALDSSADHEQDSVEMFFSEKNEKKSAYQDGDGQYRVNINNRQTFNGGNTDGFKSATKAVEGGYIVLMAVPFKYITPAAGTVVGFDAQVNDSNAEGKRTGVAIWNDPTGASWSSPQYWGDLELVTALAP